MVNFKKVLLIGVTTMLTFGLVSCSSIPFEKFILNEEVEKDIVLPSIDISKRNISIDDINDVTDTAKKIFDTLGDKDYYYKNYNNNNYLTSVSNKIDSEFYDKLKNGETKNDFKKIIDNIYFKDNTSYSECKIISAGMNSDNELFAIAEIVYVGDSKEFLTSHIKLFFNKKYQVRKTEILSEDNIVTNTTAPLGKDSLIPNRLSKEKDAINNILNSLKSKELYDLVLKDPSKANLQLDTLVNKIDIEQKSTEDLINLFKAGKGTFNTYYITEYTLNDIDSLAKSEFILSFTSGQKIENYKFIYSRITNSIESIKKI